MILLWHQCWINIVWMQVDYVAGRKRMKKRWRTTYPTRLHYQQLCKRRQQVVVLLHLHQARPRLQQQATSTTAASLTSATTTTTSTITAGTSIDNATATAKEAKNESSESKTLQTSGGVVVGSPLFLTQLMMLVGTTMNH
jgi:hypothetical protein